jgi:hypothetical protein
MIYVVGCEHPIQSSDPYPLLEGSPAVKEQRDYFRQLVGRILIDGKVELVAEEWGFPSESFAQGLAKKHMARYVNINTSFEDLAALGIPRDYMESPCYTEEQRQGWLRKREKVMLERIHSATGTAKIVLVVCGFRHLKPLTEQLGDGGCVVPVDYRKDEWYRDDVFFPESL